MKRVLPLLMMIVFSWPTYGVLSSYISGANREKLMEGEEKPESIELYEPLELDQDGETLLMLLLQQEMFARVVLEIGIDINHQDKDGRTALMLAVLNPLAMEILLQRGVDVNQQDKDGNTALMHVLRHEVIRGGQKGVELLLKYGVDVNICNKHKMTALMLAAEFYRGAENVELLLKNGANVNAQDELGRTALMIAMSEGHYEIARKLLDHGADMHLMTRRLDPLRVKKGSLAYNVYKKRWLLDEKPRNMTGIISDSTPGGDFPPLGGYTVLMDAARMSNMDAIGLLMEYGVDLTQQNRDGLIAYDILSNYGRLEEWDKAGLIRWECPFLDPYPEGRKYAPYKDYLAPNAPPLMKAVGKPDEMKKLLKGESNASYRDVEGCTALMYCVQEVCAERGDATWREACKQCVTLLIEHGVNVQMVDNEGWTALMMAVKDPECLEMLLKAGAAVNTTDMDGQTALIKAIPNEVSVELLLKYGTNINWADKDGKTALMHAIQHAEIMEMLLKHGAKVDLMDKGGNTALNLCAQLIYEEEFDAEQWSTLDQTMNVLLKHGADVNVANKYKQVPLMILSRDRPSVEKLLKHGASINVADWYGSTPLLYGVRKCDKGRDTLGSIALMLQEGADVNHGDSAGATATMFMVEGWHARNKSRNEQALRILELLINHGANLDVMSYEATKEYKKKFTKDDVGWLLLGGYTVLMKEVENNCVDVVKRLLKKGVNVEKQNRDGYTACDVAVYKRKLAINKNDEESRQKAEEIIKLLREAGATYRADINDPPPIDRKSKPYRD